MEKRVAVYNNNTGVIETMSSLLAGEGLKMVAVTGRAQLQELLRAQEISFCCWMWNWMAEAGEKALR